MSCRAFQCGFCTPGMILSVVALLREEPNPDEQTIRRWLGGNLCRCTGYGPIVAAVRQALREPALSA
jgi:aerobic carbon-monoxide dehydrogenase small subunit